MDDEHKTRRPYRSPTRDGQAADTRRAVLRAAGETFLEVGFSRASVTGIARRAGVNVDTLYRTVGRKPDLLRAVVESAISGRDVAVPADQRGYVRAVREAPHAAAKIAVYAAALAEMGPRTAPLFRALAEAAPTEPVCAALFDEITERRARNMRLFAADLRSTGEIRPDLTDDEIADVVWTMNSHEYFLMLTSRRGWSAEAVGRHLADAWCRMFLVDPVTATRRVADGSDASAWLA